MGLLNRFKKSSKSEEQLTQQGLNSALPNSTHKHIVSSGIFPNEETQDETNKQPILDAIAIKLFIQSQEDFISNQINTPGDGFDEEMRGIALKKAGRDDEALVQFYIAIGKSLDAPALYREAAILLRKYKMYAEEVEVLESGIRNVPKSNTKHRADLSARLEKAKLLAAK